jgi:hypothetical protein
VSNNGDGTPDTSPPSDGGVPRLSIGQRVLASLPNLQRPPKAPPASSPGRTAPAKSGAAGDGPDVVTPDAVVGPDGATATSGGRFRDSFMKPPAPRRQRGAPSGMSKEELAHVIKRLDDREQVMAYFSAPLGAVVGILLTVIALHQNPALHVKNHVAPSTIVFEGGARVVLAAIVAVAAWTRRRSFVAFALLFLGTSMAGGLLFALPFWALGVWLIFRVFRWQKELAALTGSQARSRPATTARTPSDPAARRRQAVEERRRARAERLNARSAGVRRGKKKPEPTGPPPSKRYTPPKPGRPKPTVP